MLTMDAVRCDASRSHSAGSSVVTTYASGAQAKTKPAAKMVSIDTMAVFTAGDGFGAVPRPPTVAMAKNIQTALISRSGLFFFGDRLAKGTQRGVSRGRLRLTDVRGGLQDTGR